MRSIKFNVSILPVIIVLSISCSSDPPTGPIGESYPDSVVATVDVGNHPIDISILPSGETVYIVNRIGNCVSVIQ